MTDTLFHIETRVGDDYFVVAPDKDTATKRLGNIDATEIQSITELDAIYQMILKAGRKEVVEFIEKAKVPLASFIGAVNTDTEIVLLKDIKAFLKLSEIE